MKHWDPAQFLRKRTTPPYTVIVLNQPIENVAVFSFVCVKASQIVAADGGANHLFNLHSKSLTPAHIHPTSIVGDFDSIHPEVREFYERMGGIEFLHYPDVMLPDFAKCLKLLVIRHKTVAARDSALSYTTIAFGSLGGRMDQAFAQIHQLYMAASNEEFNSGDLFLFTPAGVAFVLEEGENVINTPVGPDAFSENIGIIPISRPAVIGTKGFEWDVQDWHTSFETKMSTSNHIKADQVTVTTTERVLFTLEFANGN